MELEQWECGEGPGEDKEGETGIRIYCMKEHLFSIKKQSVVVHSYYNPNTRESKAKKSEVQPWLNSKFGANLAYMRFYLRRIYIL